MLGRRSAHSDHRVMAVCTVDTVTTVSAQTAPNPGTTLTPAESSAEQPTIISIFPRPARLFISANQDGANIDNHIHIAANITGALTRQQGDGGTLRVN